MISSAMELRVEENFGQETRVSGLREDLTFLLVQSLWLSDYPWEGELTVSHAAETAE